MNCSTPEFLTKRAIAAGGLKPMPFKSSETFA
jgi:hypothetical protein